MKKITILLCLLIISAFASFGDGLPVMSTPLYNALNTSAAQTTSNALVNLGAGLVVTATGTNVLTGGLTNNQASPVTFNGSVTHQAAVVMPNLSTGHLVGVDNTGALATPNSSTISGTLTAGFFVGDGSGLLNVTSGSTGSQPTNANLTGWSAIPTNLFISSGSMLTAISATNTQNLIISTGLVTSASNSLSAALIATNGQIITFTMAYVGSTISGVESSIFSAINTSSNVSQNFTLSISNIVYSNQLFSISLSNQWAYSTNWLNTNLLAQIANSNSANLIVTTGLVTSVSNNLSAQYLATNIQYFTLATNYAATQGSNFVTTSTNLIGVTGSGSSVDGTYLLSAVQNVWTNCNNPTLTVLLSAGTFFIQSNSVSEYSIGSIPGFSSIVNGIAPAPFMTYGRFRNNNGTLDVGFYNNTNLTAQTLALINQFVGEPTNGISTNYTGVVKLTNSANIFGGNGSLLTGLTPAQSGSVGTNNYAIVNAQLFPDANHTLLIWTNGPGAITNTYTFPSSTSAGFNEAQQFVPWTTSGAAGLASGIKLTLSPGVYKFSTPLWITNNEWVVGAGGPSTVFQYIGNTNLYTMANVTNALTNGASYCGLLNIYGLGNKLAGGTVFQLPNVTLEGFSIVTSTNMWCAIIYANAFNLLMKDVWVGNSNLFGPTDFHVGFVEPSVITEPQKSVGLITYGSTSVELHRCLFEGLADGFCSAGNTYTYVETCQPICCGTWNGNHSSAYPTTSELSLGFGVGVIAKGNGYYTSVSKLTSYECNIAAYFNTASSQIVDSQPQGDVHPIGLWMDSPTFNITGCQIDYPGQPPAGYVTAITNDASLNFNIDSTYLINVSVPVTAINNSGWSREFYSGNNPILELLDDNGFNGTPGIYVLGTNSLFANRIVGNGSGVTNIPLPSQVVTNHSIVSLVMGGGIDFTNPSGTISGGSFGSDKWSIVNANGGIQFDSALIQSDGSGDLIATKYSGSAAGLTGTVLTNGTSINGQVAVSTNTAVGYVWVASSSIAASGYSTNYGGVLSHTNQANIFSGVLTNILVAWIDTNNLGTNLYGGQVSIMGTRLQGGNGQSFATTTGAIAFGNNANATNVDSACFGSQNTSGGLSSFAEGGLNLANGDYSHVEGNNNFSLGPESHAEGLGGTATNTASHVEGDGCLAVGIASHSEGYLTAVNKLSVGGHSEGIGTIANGGGAHAEGYFTTANGTNSFAGGQTCISSNNAFAWSDGTYGTISSASTNTAQFWVSNGFKVFGAGISQTTFGGVTNYLTSSAASSSLIQSNSTGAETLSIGTNSSLTFNGAAVVTNGSSIYFQVFGATTNSETTSLAGSSNLVYGLAGTNNFLSANTNGQTILGGNTTIITGSNLVSGVLNAASTLNASIVYVTNSVKASSYALTSSGGSTIAANAGSEIFAQNSTSAGFNWRPGNLPYNLMSIETTGLNVSNNISSMAATFTNSVTISEAIIVSNTPPSGISNSTACIWDNGTNLLVRSSTSGAASSSADYTIAHVETGTTNAIALTSFTATFAAAFIDTNYTAIAAGNGIALASAFVSNKTTNSCLFNMTAATGNIDWMAVHK